MKKTLTLFASLIASVRPFLEVSHQTTSNISHTVVKASGAAFLEYILP
jgi:hypothetical protein